MYEYRCDERLKAKVEGYTRLRYTGFREGQFPDESVRIKGSPIHYVNTQTKILGTVYYESMKRELKKRLIFECRCDERLKSKVEGSTHLTYTSI